MLSTVDHISSFLHYSCLVPRHLLVRMLVKNNILQFIQNIYHFSSTDICVFKQLDCAVKWTLDFLSGKVRYDRSFICKLGFV